MVFLEVLVITSLYRKGSKHHANVKIDSPTKTKSDQRIKCRIKYLKWHKSTYIFEKGFIINNLLNL